MGGKQVKATDVPPKKRALNASENASETLPAKKQRVDESSGEPSKKPRGPSKRPVAKIGYQPYVRPDRTQPSRFDSLRSLSAHASHNPSVTLKNSSTLGEGESSTPTLSKSALRQLETQQKQSRIKAEKEMAALEKTMTPCDFAEHCMWKWSEKIKTFPPEKVPLKGCNIFYVDMDQSTSTERTRKKMEHLVKHGANLMDTFDPEVTQYIVTAEDQANHTIRRCGVKRLTDLPDHIPTVSWNWVASVIQGHKPAASRFEVFEVRKKMAPTKPKLSAPITWLKKKKAPEVVPETDEEDNHNDYTDPVLDSADSPAKSWQRKEAKGKGKSKMEYIPEEDPIAEFFWEGARMKQDEALFTNLEYGDSKNERSQAFTPEPDQHRVNPSKSRVQGFQCDVPNSDSFSKPCPNQDIVDKLVELQALHKAKPTDEDHWRDYSYQKSIRNIKAHPTRIKSYEEALSIKCVGERTAHKIMEIIETGKLERIAVENSEDAVTARLFMTIYGVGTQTAYSWYNMGLRTLDDVRNGKAGVTLTEVQKIGLRFQKDINTRIPRDEVQLIFDRIKNIARNIDRQIIIEVMGSFRRGKETCGDIDVLVTRPTDDGHTHQGFIRKLLNALHEEEILTYDLSMPDDLEDLETSYRGLCIVDRQEGRLQRRIDILSVPYESLGAALIYYTGDDIFNRSMRLKASKLGYSLNQRGLSEGVVRDPKDRSVKLSKGNLIKGLSERQIFEKLGVPWQEPHERVRG